MTTALIGTTHSLDKDGGEQKRVNHLCKRSWEVGSNFFFHEMISVCSVIPYTGT